MYYCLKPEIPTSKAKGSEHVIMQGQLVRINERGLATTYKDMPHEAYRNLSKSVTIIMTPTLFKAGTLLRRNAYLVDTRAQGGIEGVQTDSEGYIAAHLLYTIPDREGL